MTDKAPEKNEEPRSTPVDSGWSPFNLPDVVTTLFRGFVTERLEVRILHQIQGIFALVIFAMSLVGQSFNADWSANLQANYNTKGKFEIGDRYLVYTGLKSAGAKIGTF